MCDDCSDTSTDTSCDTSDTTVDTSSDTTCDTSNTTSELPEDSGDLSDDGSEDLPENDYQTEDVDMSEGDEELYDTESEADEVSDDGSETLPDENVDEVPDDGSEALPDDNVDEVSDDGSDTNNDNETSDDVKSENSSDSVDANKSNEDKDEFFGFGKKEAKEPPKEFDTQRAKDMVPHDEYKNYKKMYDHLDKLDIPQDYKNVLCDRYSKMDPELKTMYNDYADRLKCLDTQAKGTAYYSKSEGGFKLDCNDDLNNPLGAGNTYFHESGHMIDSLKGEDANSVNSASYDGYMSEAVHEDYYNAIDNIKRDNNCDDATAQQILSKELKSNPIASNTVSDVFGGVTNNKVHGAYGHWGDYWSNRGPDAVGKEAFAEITADRACNNTDSISFTNKYLPNTVQRYNDIIGRRK